MPEFPEVYTITKNLNELLSDATLLDVEIINSHPKISTLEEFISLLNLKVLKVKNVSKSIIFEFSDNKKIISHLAMTGRFRFSNQKELFGWDKIRFKFSKENKIFYLNFTDTRKFGKLIISNQIPNQIFPNPLEYSENEIEKIIKKITKSNKTIKELLLDQNTFSGLGNIYSNDTLHISKVHPEEKGSNLNENQIRNIILNAQKILKEGIDLGGSSLYDKMYTNIYGEEGKYQQFFKVYNQKICKDCNNQIKKIKISGRGTFYCPKCLDTN